MSKFYRYLSVRAEDVTEDGMLNIVASTNAAVSMGNWREVLEHNADSIETSAATAVLFNHNSDNIIGAIRGMDADGTELRAQIELMQDVKAPNGASIREMVDMGALRGISVGYTYDRENVDFNRETKVLTVKKWRLLEISMTPIPADAEAGVRSVPFVDQTPEFDDGTVEEERTVSDADKNEGVQPTPNPAEIEAKTRADVKERVRFAVSHGIEADLAVELNMDQLKDKALERATAELAKRDAPKAPVAEVVADAADKWIDHASENFARYSAEQLMRKCAQFDGDDADADIATLAQRSAKGLSYKRDAANKTTSSFSVLVNNTANKQLMSGFDMYTPVWQEFCTVKDAANFNAHSHAGLSSGRLIETAEDVAFPELVQKEGSYSSTLALWGATISITYQTLVNDDLGEIMRGFTKAGYASARTIEREVFYKLLNATWTNDVTASAPLGTAGNLDKVRSGIKGKLSPSGEKMENDMAILLVDTLNRYNADIATGALYSVGTGGTGQVGSNAVRGVKVIDSTFVGDTSLKAGVASTDYYVFNNPMVVDTVVVEFLRGQRAPQIMEFDAGATAATKYKIMLPFAATVATHTDSASNARVSGAQKATA